MSELLPADDLVTQLRRWHAIKGASCFREAADEIESLRARLAQAELAARTNAETIKTMQAAPKKCEGEHAWSGPFCMICGEMRSWSFS